MISKERLQDVIAKWEQKVIEADDFANVDGTTPQELAAAEAEIEAFCFCIDDLKAIIDGVK